MKKLVSVKAPHFCAGLWFEEETGKVTGAAPILRWSVGKTWAYCARYFARKGYEVVVMDFPSPAKGNT